MEPTLINKPKEISVKEGTHILVDEIKDYIQNGTPMSELTEIVLTIYKPQKSLQEILQNKNKSEIAGELSRAINLFSKEEIDAAISTGKSLAQEISPNHIFNNYPIFFLYYPTRDGAKSLNGQGCAINIREYLRLDKAKGLELLASSIGHEWTHLYIRELNLQPPINDKISIDQYINNFLWIEGLTTLMEIYKEPYQKEFINDADFWIMTINKWMNPQTKEEEKLSLLQEIKRTKSITEWANYYKIEIDYLIDPKENADSNFKRILTNMNGMGYHIGYFLWKKQIEKGKQLPELVSNGYTSMRAWIKEYIQ